MSSIISSASSWLHKLKDELQNVNRTTLYAVVSAGALLVIYIASQPSHKRKRPPGPRLLSNVKLNQMDIKEMDTLVNKYGPIINFRFLSFNMLLLCDMDSIKDALIGQGDAFAGRLQTPVSSYTHKDCGVLFIDGPKWQEHRRFVLSTLRSFGFGKNITERIIQEELVQLCDEYAKLAGSAVYPQQTLVKAAANVICLLIFSERCADNKNFDELLKAADESINSTAFSSFFVVVFFRLILLLPGDYFGIKNFFASLKDLQAFIEVKMDEHRRTIDWENERNLIDAYLVEIRKHEQENPGKHTFTEFQLFRIILELFLAGIETTSTTLTWALYLMARYPHIQARVQAEIDSVIGDKLPQIADRTKLVYTTAVLYEIERYASVLPFSVPHRTVEDTEVRGYFIPKNTMVMPYLFGAHRNERIWKNAKKFDPSHFYDESSNSLINLQNMIPFGVGKRACLGESLATQELFVFFTGLLQRFRFEADASHPLPDIVEDKLFGIIRHCPKYKLAIAARKFE